MNNNGGVESCTRRSECFLVIKVLEWNFMNPEGWLLLEEMSWVKVVRGKGVEKGGERRGGGEESLVAQHAINLVDRH